MLSSYELIFITDPSEDKSKKVLAAAKKLVSDKGSGLEEISWGKKPLSYKIKKQSEGFYHLFKFAMEGHEVRGFEDKLKVMDGMIRHLIVKSEKKKVKNKKESKEKSKEVDKKTTKKAKRKE